MGEAALKASAREGHEATGLRLLCLLPSIPLGGMERATIRVVDQLRCRGAEAHFVLEQRWGIEVQRHVEASGASWSGMPFVAALGRPKTLLELRWAARSWLFSAADMAQLAEVYRPQQLLATNVNVAYFARHLARRDALLSVFRLPNPPGMSQSRIKRAIDRAVWRAVYASFDRLVCNANYTAERLAEVVQDDAKIFVIRNFPPARRAIAHSDAPSRVPGLRRIVYLGQIARHKGVDVLIEATWALMMERQDFELVLAGPNVWQDPFGEAIRARVQELGLQSRIRFLGVVADVPALLESADVHVCPSISAGESFPNVVIEAKQAGLPSVVFPTAGLPEAVTDELDGLVTPDRSAASLVAALARLLDDEPLRKRLVEGARRSLADYAKDVIARRWIEVLTAPKRAIAL